MQENHREALPAGLVGGCLEGIQLLELIWELGRRRCTGVLEILRSPIRRRLHLHEGAIVFVGSSDPNDRLGEMLLRQGKITLEQLERALRHLRTGKRIGTLLVEAGALTSEELVDAVLEQVRTVTLDVLGWEEGEYDFAEGALPTKEAITLQVGTSELLLQAVRNIRSFGRIRRSVGSAQTMFSIAEQGERAPGSLQLTPGERLVLQRLKKRPAVVEELCEDLALSNFEVYQALWAFKVLHLISVLPRVRDFESGIGTSGSFSDEGFPEAFVRVSRSGETGVLHVTRRGVERSFHLRSGHCVFATSNQADDGLVAYLLRRGVISLRDRDETAKRLLSNKRVGAILLDIGALDPSDLKDMVRQQLAEIVYDTCSWESGEFFFVPGRLPSNEEITLDREVPSLVAEGVRRVRSWTRVIRGCGGVDNPLALSENYLDMLDRMSAGVDEWDVVNTLKEPQTPRRICGQLGRDNFRACQVLWTLRLVGAIEGAPLDHELPDELPPPEFAAAAARAVGEDVLEDVQVALRELPDTADLLTRNAVYPGDLAHELDDSEETLESTAAGSPAGPELLDLDDSAGEDDTLQSIAEDDPVELPEAEIVASPEGPTSVFEGDDKIVLEVADEVVMSPRTDFDLPDGLEDDISQFNAMHRLVYRAVRSEIGAGAVNFVHSCCGQSAGEPVDPLEGVQLHADGSWDADELKQVVADKRIADPWSFYCRVLDKEFVLLAPHLGEVRANELKQQIWKLEQERSRSGN